MRGDFELIELFTKREAVSVEGNNFKRCKLYPGTPMLLCDAVVTLFADRQSKVFGRDHFELQLAIDLPGKTQQRLVLNTAGVIDMSAYAGVLMTPIALHIKNNCVEAVTVDLVLVARDRRFVN